jgi:hypothetical protein
MSALHLRNGPVLGTAAAPSLKTGVRLCIAIGATGRFAASGRAEIRSNRGKAGKSRARGRFLGLRLPTRGQSKLPGPWHPVHKDGSSGYAGARGMDLP